MYLWCGGVYAPCTYPHVSVIVGDSGLCCCVYVTPFARLSTTFVCWIYISSLGFILSEIIVIISLRRVGSYRARSFSFTLLLSWTERWAGVGVVQCWWGVFKFFEKKYLFISFCFFNQSTKGRLPVVDTSSPQIADKIKKQMLIVVVAVVAVAVHL